MAFTQKFQLPALMAAAMQEFKPDTQEYSLSTLNAGGGKASASGFDCDFILLTDAETTSVTFNDSKGMKKTVPKFICTVAVFNHPGECVDVHSLSRVSADGFALHVDVFREISETITVPAKKSKDPSKPAETEPTKRNVKRKEPIATRMLYRGSVEKLCVFGKAGKRTHEGVEVDYIAGDIIRVSGVTLKESSWYDSKSQEWVNYINMNGSDVLAYKGHIYSLEKEANLAFATVHQYVDMSYYLPFPSLKTPVGFDVVGEARKIRMADSVPQVDGNAAAAPAADNVHPDSIVDVVPDSAAPDASQPLYTASKTMEPGWEDWSTLGDKALSEQARNWKKLNADVYLCNQESNGYIVAYKESAKHLPNFYHTGMLACVSNEGLFVYNPLKEAELYKKQITDDIRNKPIKSRFKYGQNLIQTRMENDKPISEYISIHVTDMPKALFNNLGIATERLQRALFPVLFPRLPVLTRNWLSGGDSAKVNWGSKDPRKWTMIANGTSQKGDTEAHCFLLPDYAAGVVSAGHELLFEDVVHLFRELAKKRPTEYGVNMNSARITANKNRGESNPLNTIESRPVINLMESTYDLSDKEYDISGDYNFFIVADWGVKAWDEFPKLKKTIEELEEKKILKETCGKIFRHILATGTIHEDYPTFEPIREDVTEMTFCIFGVKKTVLEARGMLNYHGNNIFGDRLVHSEAQLKDKLVLQEEEEQQQSQSQPVVAASQPLAKPPSKPAPKNVALAKPDPPKPAPKPKEDQVMTEPLKEQHEEQVATPTTKNNVAKPSPAGKRKKTIEDSEGEQEDQDDEDLVPPPVKSKKTESKKKPVREEESDEEEEEEEQKQEEEDEDDEDLAPPPVKSKKASGGKKSGK